MKIYKSNDQENSKPFSFANNLFWRFMIDKNDLRWRIFATNQRLPSFKQKTIVNRDDQESPRGSGNIFLYCFRYIVFRMSLFFSSRYLFWGESYIFLLNATDICGYFCLNYYFLTLSNHHMCCLYFQLFYKN